MSAAHPLPAEQIDVCPCDLGCPSRERCRVEKLACMQFSMYLNGASRGRWSRAKRMPTRERYTALSVPKE